MDISELVRPDGGIERQIETVGGLLRCRTYAFSLDRAVGAAAVVVEAGGWKFTLTHTETSVQRPFDDICLLFFERLEPGIIGKHERFRPENLENVIPKDKEWRDFPTVLVGEDGDGLCEKLGNGIHIIESLPPKILGLFDGAHRTFLCEESGWMYVAEVIPGWNCFVIINNGENNVGRPNHIETVAGCFSAANDQELMEPKTTSVHVMMKNQLLMHVRNCQVMVEVRRIEQVDSGAFPL